MKYLQLMHTHLDTILDLSKEEIRKDVHLKAYYNSDEELEVFLTEHAKLLKEYLEVFGTEEEVDDSLCLDFYRHNNMPYSLIYKSLQIFKTLFMKKILDEINSKEDVIAITSYFEKLVHLVAKIYIKRDITKLQDTKILTSDEYLLIKAHHDWINNIVAAITKEQLELFPLINDKECSFHNYLNYPESMMVCLDVNLCKYIHDLHTLIHKTANTFYLFYRKKDFTQAYIIFNELLEAVLKFNKTVSELYLLAYADAEESLFKFIEVLLYDKTENFNLTLIDFKQLKKLNKNYGEIAVNKLLHQIKEKLFTLVQAHEEKMLLVKGLTADYYLLDFGYTGSEGLEAFNKEIFALTKSEYTIDDKSIPLEAIVVTMSLGEMYGKNRNDLTKLLLHIKEMAKEKESALIIDSHKEINQLKEWLNKEYNDIDFINKKLNDGAIDIMLQPIFNIKSGEVEVVEALARIVNDDGSFVPAGVFIDTIYNIGKIELLDGLVLQKLQEHKKELQIIAKTVFVNISYQSLKSNAYRDKFREFVHSFKNESIIFELTEQVMVENIQEIKKLHKEYDVHFAVDDFGSGYSSLKTVADLAGDGLLKVLKVDESLVKNLHYDAIDNTIVGVISTLSSSLELSSVGEFIENKEVLEKLQAHGITYGQGFYLSKPKRVEELVVAKLNGTLKYETA